MDEVRKPFWHSLHKISINQLSAIVLGLALISFYSYYTTSAKTFNGYASNCGATIQDGAGLEKCLKPFMDSFVFYQMVFQMSLVFIAICLALTLVKILKKN